MAITAAVNDLLKSIYELTASVLGTFYAIVHSLITAILSFVNGFFILVGDVVTWMVDIAGGVGKFVAGNVALVAVGAVAAAVYVRYTAHGQKDVGTGKKTQ